MKVMEITEEMVAREAGCEWEAIHKPAALWVAERLAAARARLTGQSQTVRSSTGQVMDFYPDGVEVMVHRSNRRD